MGIWDNTIMLWAGQKVSDHNRAELQVSTERIENSARMVDGTMRRYTIAKKRTFTASWDNFPSQDTDPKFGPVDGGMGGETMKTFWQNHDAPFTLTLKSGQGVATTYKVMFTDFSYNVLKRGPNTDLWSINVTLVEV